MDTLDSFDTFNSSVKIGGQTITNLRFADDIDFICSNEEDLRQLTLLLDVNSKEIWHGSKRRKEQDTDSWERTEDTSAINPNKRR